MLNTSNLQKTVGKKLKKTFHDMLPASLRDTMYLRAFGFLKVPMIFFCSPKVAVLNDYRCVVTIPLSRSTKNHLGSMYFGVLCTGADCAGGLIAMKLIEDEGAKVSLVFKDFKAEFLKRAEGEVHFACEQGEAIRALVRRALDSDQRENLSVHVVATVPTKFGTEPVARFELTLSLKKR